MKFTLYPIYWVADQVDDEQFDRNLLPFDIAENVRIESVENRFRNDAFVLWAEKIGADNDIPILHCFSAPSSLS